MKHITWIATILGILLKLCEGSGVIELLLVSYDVTNGSLAGSTTACCDTGVPNQCPLNQCDPYFYICVQDVVHLSGCPQGERKTDFTENNDHLKFSATIGNPGTSNPIVFHVSEYPGTIVPKITVYDEDKSQGGAQDDKIDYLQHVHTFPPDYNNNRTNVYRLNMQGQVSSLRVDLNVRCDERYYGNDCKKYCEPDDQRYCDNKGDLVCITGKPCDPNRTPRTPKPTTTTASTSTASTVSSTLTKSAMHSSMSSQTSSAPASQSSTGSTLTSSAKASTMMLTTDAQGKTCELQRHAADKTGVYRISLLKSANVTSVRAQLISSVAMALSVNTSDVSVNVSVVNHTNTESIYDVVLYKTASQQIVATSVSDPVVKGVCPSIARSPRSKQSPPADPQDSKTGLIAGVVSAVLVSGGLAPLLFFLYKRKCRRTQISDSDAISENKRT